MTASPVDDRDWTEKSREILRERRGRIPAEDAAGIVAAEGATIETVMNRLLPIARSHARPPVSNYHVGAVALATSGALYLGANFEVAANALNQTVHAEQSALANAYAGGEKGIAAIAVTAAPCGHCRQFLNEITDGSRIRILVDGQPVRTLEDLLPASFGPKDLGMPAGMFGSFEAPLRLGSNSGDRLVREALDAASRSYAPHTKARSGCALAVKSGRIFAGSYLENAAFNPSLSPLQSALVSLIFAGEEPSAIERVAVVEIDGAAISQRASTEAVLSVVAPGARLDVVLAFASK
jgi:cytidine deaminase